VEYVDDTLMTVTDSELLHVLKLVGYTEEMPELLLRVESMT
jgi:hypothetical protein